MREMTEPSRIYSRAFVKYKRVLDRKVDRNADTLRQTIMDTCKQDPPLQATGRTATNSHGQPRPYPVIGTLLYWYTQHEQISAN